MLEPTRGLRKEEESRPYAAACDAEANPSSVTAGATSKRCGVMALLAGFDVGRCDRVGHRNWVWFMAFQTVDDAFAARVRIIRHRPVEGDVRIDRHAAWCNEIRRPFLKRLKRTVAGQTDGCAG